MLKKRWDKSRLPSRHVTEGPGRAPHRSYYYAMGLTEDEINQPFVGVATCWNEAAPCNIALNRQAQSVKIGVKDGGGTPARVHDHHRHRRHRHGPPGHEEQSRIPRRDRRQRGAHGPRATVTTRWWGFAGLRQEPAGHDDGDAAAKHPERVHVWRQHPAGSLQGAGRDRGGRVRGRGPARRRAP